MFASDPRNTTLSLAQTQPGLYANFRHSMTATVSTDPAKTGKALKLPIAGRANFIFLDGHAKNLDMDTIYQKATTENGHNLVVETSPSNFNPATQYILWNIY